MSNSKPLDISKKREFSLLESHLHVNARSARGNFSRLVNTARIDKERVVITEHGEPAAAIVSITDLEKLEEIPDLDWIDEISEAEFHELGFSEVKKLLGKGDTGDEIPDKEHQDERFARKTA